MTMPSQEETLTGKELVEGEQDRWPLIWMSRKTGISFLTACLRRTNAEAIGDEIERYYPASHPAVLSKAEARLLGDPHAPRDPEQRAMVRRARARLSAWAEEGER
jgi:hypothetical protein